MKEKIQLYAYFKWQTGEISHDKKATWKRAKKY